MSSTQDLGLVTAYGYAVEGGYTGTEAEFKTLLGSQQTYHDEAVQAAEDAEAYAAQAMSGTPDGYASLVSTVNSLNSALTNLKVLSAYYTGNSIGEHTITLESGKLYIVVVSALNVVSAYSGMYIVAPLATASNITAIKEASSNLCTVTVDALTLTVTTARNYVKVGLLEIST